MICTFCLFTIRFTIVYLFTSHCLPVYIYVNFYIFEKKFEIKKPRGIFERTLFPLKTSMFKKPGFPSSGLSDCASQEGPFTLIEN